MSAHALKATAAMAGALGALVAIFGACSVADPDVGVLTPPSDATNWYPVETYLNLRCGTLDCHGNSQRNLVIYGCDGLRLDLHEAGLTPGCARQGGINTVPDEYNATFRSLVGLEPSVMTYEEQIHGTDPELLTFIRKARGEEVHKGNQLIVPGDYQDECVSSWLTGTTDVAACTKAIAYATAVGVAPAAPQGDAGQ